MPLSFREGHGETTYKDGSSYVGEWKNGFFHGFGELKYSNGVVYKVRKSRLSSRSVVQIE